MHDLAILAGLFVASVAQNAAFTAVSRSRNSGDVWHHARWSVASNGIWFGIQVLLWSTIWRAIESGTWAHIAEAAIVYVAATTIGSCAMMWHMLRTEKGKQKVGARAE